ncbi:MAG TPA: DUF2442 domain-containing protein [Spirochaetota bacterium]|nr:DUF2442 domain-containing protein [Spirochaetota bacterium]
MSYIAAKQSTELESAALRARSEGRTVLAELADGRIIGFPADRFAILKTAGEDQLREVPLRPNGYALRWESLEEDITVPGIIAGHFEPP